MRWVVICACLAGCSLQAPDSEPAPLRPGEVLSARTAEGGLTLGKSTKAEVRAVLGEATVVDFDTGYELWVYRERLRENAAPPATELVLLFEPSGFLVKTRVR